MIMESVLAGDNPEQRLYFGAVMALVLHGLVVFSFYGFKPENTIAADIMSMPTSVNIRFISPAKPVQDTPPPPAPKWTSPETAVTKPLPVEKPESKPRAQPVVQKETRATKPQHLNRIEPASAPPVTNEMPADIIPESIPVVRDVNLKGRRIAPDYPRRALHLRQEGVVRLHVLVSKAGRLQDIKIVEHSGFALLDEAALKAVRQWQFEPTNINGNTVKSWVEVPVEFKIN